MINKRAVFTLNARAAVCAKERSGDLESRVDRFLFCDLSEVCCYSVFKKAIIIGPFSGRLSLL